MRDNTKKYKLHTDALEINTGEMLKHYFKAHRTRKAAMARALKRGSRSVLQYQKNSSIQTAILWEICKVLKHNFFLDIAAKLPPEYSTYAPSENTLQEKINTLEVALAQAQAERDILLKALSK